MDVNNNKILKTKWEHEMKKSLNVIGSVQQQGAQDL